VCQIKSERRMLWLQFGGLKRGRVLNKGENTDRVPRGLIMQEGEEIEEI